MSFSSSLEIKGLNGALSRFYFLESCSSPTSLNGQVPGDDFEQSLRCRQLLVSPFYYSGVVAVPVLLLLAGSDGLKSGFLFKETGMVDVGFLFLSATLGVVGRRTPGTRRTGGLRTPGVVGFFVAVFVTLLTGFFVTGFRSGGETGAFDLLTGFFTSIFEALLFFAAAGLFDAAGFFTGAFFAIAGVVVFFTEVPVSGLLASGLALTFIDFEAPLVLPESVGGAVLSVSLLSSFLTKPGTRNDFSV